MDPKLTDGAGGGAGGGGVGFAGGSGYLPQKVLNAMGSCDLRSARLLLQEASSLKVPTFCMTGDIIPALIITIDHT